MFDETAINPPLTTTEVLACFREGSQIVTRTYAEIESKGLSVVQIEGADTLPQRLRDAHREIRPGPDMTRGQFKAALKELE